MNFLNPFLLALAALAVPIIALYFLKLRREEHTVSSTYLWRTLVRDTAANAPWQRLQPNLLLLLQLLALALLVLALARPFTWSQGASGDHLILILDTSASMAGRDEAPNRLAAAIGEARQLVASLPSSARVTLIAASGRTTTGSDLSGAAGSNTEVRVSGSTDRHQLYQALDALRAGTGGSDLSAAVNLASAIAARERDPETVMLSDGSINLPSHVSLPGRVRFIPVGRPQAANQGILAFSLQHAAGGQALSAFLQVENFGPQAVQRQLVLTSVASGASGGQVLAARSLDLPPGQSQPLTFEDLPAELDTVEARLEGTDSLPADDTAWAVSPARTATRIDLVSPGNRFLETALALLPGLQVTVVKPDDYKPAACEPGAGDCATPDLTIIDGVPAPSTLPAGPLLFLAPIQSTVIFSVTGKLDAPTLLPARADEPLLRYVDVRDVAIQETAQIPLPAWARAVLVAGNTPTGVCASGDEAGAAGCPLLFAGETGGRRLAVLAFDLRKSDLPLRVAFPLLLANLLDYLNAGPALPVAQIQPGQPVTLPLPPGATALTVTRPNGTAERLEAGAGPTVYGGTDQLGIYQVQADGASGEAAPGQFAVNLFDAQESALTVNHALTLSGTAEAGSGAAGRQSRQEWWRPLAWLALVALQGEWLYAHRSQLFQLRDAVTKERVPHSAARR